MISKIISSIISIFFPIHCFICKKENLITPLCSQCLSNIQKSIDTPAPYITSLYSFKNNHIKKIIHAIKYFHRKDLIEPFARDIAKAIVLEESHTSYTLVPIPMPQLRKYIRGYNHTEVLAQLISKELIIPYSTALLKNNSEVSKKRQVMTHSRNERLENKKKAFTASKDVKGMNIILIDDVTTTGATLHEARKVLLSAGAARVIAYTIAH